MKKAICLVLVLVFAASFATGIFANKAEAKVMDCWTHCGDGDVLWKCCEVPRGPYIVLLRCRILSPVTPC